MKYLKRFFRFTQGRQNASYSKLKIFSFWRMDCYLIKYKAGLAIDYHTDDIPGKKHYRLNIQLKGIDRLTELLNIERKQSRVKLFRADKPHSFGVTLENGLILSFGIAI